MEIILNIGDLNAIIYILTILASAIVFFYTIRHIIKIIKTETIEKVITKIFFIVIGIIGILWIALGSYGSGQRPKTPKAEEDGMRILLEQVEEEPSNEEIEEEYKKKLPSILLEVQNQKEIDSNKYIEDAIKSSERRKK